MHNRMELLSMDMYVNVCGCVYECVWTKPLTRNIVNGFVVTTCMLQHVYVYAATVIMFSLRFFSAPHKCDFM